MATLFLTLVMVVSPDVAAKRRPAAAVPTIQWSDFFASVTNQGVVFSDRLKALEGQRVRLRGYSVTQLTVPGGLLLTRIPFAESDPHESGAEMDLPFDSVAVVWRAKTALPPIPRYPTVEGILRLGNHTLGGQVVVMTLEDAVPVFPEKAKAKSQPA